MLVYSCTDVRCVLTGLEGSGVVCNGFMEARGVLWLESGLPDPLQPKLLQGKAVVGMCLIRLEQIRPLWFPVSVGMSSENAAHRIAVCWKDADGVDQEGVYIPRRDSNSVVNYLLGGRAFPGEHHRADFNVIDDGTTIDFHASALDKSFSIDLKAREVQHLPVTSLFSSLTEASDFFKHGSLGYSETAEGNRLDGIVLSTKNWEVKPLDVESAESSYFNDKTRFPSGSLEFDCALLMRNIDHEWQAAPEMKIESRCVS